MTYNRLLFYFLIAGLIISGVLTSKNNFLIKTPNAKLGIVSLEACADNQKQSIILNEWKKNFAYFPKYNKDSLYSRERIYGLPTAVLQTKFDFAFIAFYVGLLVFLISVAKPFYEKSFLNFKLAIWLPGIAGLFDCIENLFELRSMSLIDQGHTTSGLAVFVFIPALIKTILLLFTIGSYYYIFLRKKQADFFDNLNRQLKDLVAGLWHFRIVVIGLILLYVILNFLEQGLDLVISINSSPYGVFWFLLVIIVLAIMNWYWPKIYELAYKNKGQYKWEALYRFENKYDYSEDELVKKYLTRIIGASTFLVPAVGILSAMQSYHIAYYADPIPPAIIFYIVIFFYVQIVRFDLLDRIYLKDAPSKNNTDESNPNDRATVLRVGRYWVTFGTVFLLIIVSFFVYKGQPAGLILLSLDFFLMSFVFLITVIYRHRFKGGPPFASVQFIASAAISMFFILFNFRFFSSFITAGNRFYTLPVFVAGLIFYTLVLSLLLISGLKFKFQPITILLVASFVISSGTISDFHRVKTIPLTAEPMVKEDSLSSYIHNWLESRRSEISSQANQGKKYPVFFVNAYGGGIKAAAWTTMVVGRLNSVLYEDRANSTAFPDFEHYAFSYSGASGGTIGLSLLAGARLAHPENPLNDHVFKSKDTTMRFYKHDYLTNDLVGILGRDFWMGSSGLNFYADRAKVTEEAWEKYAKTLDIKFDQVLRTGWKDKKMEVPLFVSNTYDIDGGSKAIIAPVKLRATDFPGALMIQELIKRDEDINLSSAAFLSARFPFVSPTGKFNEKHHFTDGGTIENSGAETSLQLIRVFKRIVDTLTRQTGRPEDKVFNSIQICILSIPNSIPPMDSVERVRNLYETSAPLSGILNTINGNAIKADSENHVTARLYGWPYFKMFPHDEKIEDGNIHPILPLGWQISDYALELMYVSAARKNSSDLIAIRKLFMKNFGKQATTTK